MMIAALGVGRLVQLVPLVEAEAPAHLVLRHHGEVDEVDDVLAEVAEAAPRDGIDVARASSLCSTCARLAFSALRWRGKMTQ